MKRSFPRFSKYWYPSSISPQASWGRQQAMIGTQNYRSGMMMLAGRSSRMLMSAHAGRVMRYSSTPAAHGIQVYYSQTKNTPGPPVSVGGKLTFQSCVSSPCQGDACWWWSIPYTVHIRLNYSAILPWNVLKFLLQLLGAPTTKAINTIYYPPVPHQTIHIESCALYGGVDQVYLHNLPNCFSLIGCNFECVYGVCTGGKLEQCLLSTLL